MTTEQTILLQRDGPVATITLNRPAQLNAINRELITALHEALVEAEADAAVRCVVITGAGRAFCAGQDLKVPAEEFSPAAVEEVVRRQYNPVIERIRGMDKPVVAAVNGVAAGAGCSLALACDLRIASTEASFLEIFSRIGLIPDAGSTWFLPRLVGLGRTMEMVLLAEPLPAEEALRWGLVTRVAAPADFPAAVRELAHRLAAGPTRAHALAKRALNFALTHSLEDALVNEARTQQAAAQTADFVEGVSAFLERRPARYEGQ